MSKAIPYGADSDDSYEIIEGMTNADGDVYYRRNVPANPVSISKTVEGQTTIVVKRPDFPDDPA